MDELISNIGEEGKHVSNVHVHVEGRPLGSKMGGSELFQINLRDLRRPFVGDALRKVLILTRYTGI